MRNVGRLAAGLVAVVLLSSAAVKAQPVASHVDGLWFHNELQQFVDLWNGGKDRATGTEGMRVYRSDWDGLFRMNLDRQFNRINYYTNDQSVISQSRALYLNVEAYRNAAAVDRPRFLRAAQKGADYILSHAKDPNTYDGLSGGFWWGLQFDGTTPPTNTTHIFGTAPRDKMAYGQVHAMYSLSHAYEVTGDPDHLAGALFALDTWLTQFKDGSIDGAYLPTQNESMTQLLDVRNLDYTTHAFEAMMALHDALPDGHARKADLAAEVARAGDFICFRLARPVAGTSMAYLPWWYSSSWDPHPDASRRYATPGHNIEIAYLLSRGVERGFNAAWLTTAEQLLAHGLKYGFDADPSSKTYGAVKYDAVDFNGNPTKPQPENIIWWPTSEVCRALMHFATVRGKTDLWDEFDASLKWIRTYQIDTTYGGWYTSIDPVNLTPTETNKGTVWTAGYHEAMLYAEALRLTPAAVQLAATTTPPTIDGSVDAAWSAATAYRGTPNSLGKINSGSDCEVSWKGLWDLSNLYLLVEVTDDATIKDSASVWDDDAVEVFVDGNGARGTAYDGNDKQYAFGWGRTVAVGGAGTNGNVTGVSYAKTDIDATHYRMEIRIPWSAVGHLPVSGSKVGLDVQIGDDDDGGVRDGKTTWADADGTAATSPAAMGIARLTGTPPVLPPPPVAEGTGLKGSYFPNAGLSGTATLVRTDPKVDFAWAYGGPAAGFRTDNFSARWTGSVKAPADGAYTFSTRTDDGARLWVNGVLLVDDWVRHAAADRYATTTVNLKAGDKVAIRLEYFENSGRAEAGLYWSYPGQARQIIPTPHLYTDETTPPPPPPPPGDGGLKGEYFSGYYLTPPAILTRVDPQVKFNWGSGSPGSPVGADRFSARWTGQIVAAVAGIYSFATVSDDGVRLWIDDKLVIDNWVRHGATVDTAAPMSLTAGQKVKVKMEYYENSGGAVAELRWAYPGQSSVAIPAANLVPAN